MVFVNSKKFACESCIKGHRSSSCHHTERPLFEIKKKGRPVSQCERCRQLRKSKKFHSKCTCNTDTTEQLSVAVSTTSKSKRYISIIPALPNGLRDILSAASTSLHIPPDSRQKVASLLNPCNCESVWLCNCLASRRSESCDEPGQGLTESLVTLAHTAALHSEISLASGVVRSHPKLKQRSRPSSPQSPSHKRSKRNNPASLPQRGPDLPPIHLLSESESSPHYSIPDFDTMPPMSIITSLAGSGCTCGVRCACPGCVEHRGNQHAAKDRTSCADGCGTCIDSSSSVITLPGYKPTVSSTNYLDRFFARAAALPPPPTHRKLAAHLDPNDVQIYSNPSHSVLSGRLPKLDCCGGGCRCPDGNCGCGRSCVGCCSDSNIGNKFLPVQEVATSSLTIIQTNEPVVRSCCASKV